MHGFISCEWSEIYIIRLTDLPAELTSNFVRAELARLRESHQARDPKLGIPKP